MSQTRTTQILELVKNGNGDAITTIDFAHHEIHDGSSFTASFQQDIANGGNMDILIVTPNSTKYAHFTYALEVELETNMFLYEGAIATAAANPIVAYNRNRNSLTEATVVVTHTPTGITTGSTIIRQNHLGSGKTVGGDDRTVNEFILKKNTKYLLRLTNLVANATNYCSVRLNWYEH